MIKHIVCFKLKDPTPLTLNKTRETLMSMKGRVPEIVDIEVGTDFLHSDRSYDVVLIVTVKDKLALESYQQDPYHCAVVKTYIHSVRSASVAVDFEF